MNDLRDPDDAPAPGLAALCPERWEIEGALDEFKTPLRGNTRVLRSRTPELVLQELWSLLPAHAAICQLIALAA